MKIYKLSKTQLKMEADIVANIGYACLASIIIPSVIDVDAIPPLVVLFGVIACVSCWITSIVLSR